MGKKRKNLTEQEVWDDSELIQSWNDSYEEYKLYHSIHARGERVKDVLAAAQSGDQQENANAVGAGQTASPHKRENDQIPEDGELEDEAGSIQTGFHAADDPKAMKSPQLPSVHPSSGTNPERPTQGPQDIPNRLAMGSSRDEALKSLMMSWYWAGYYTGLYEGQIQGGGTSHA